MAKMSEKQKQRRRDNRSKKRIEEAKARQLNFKNEFGVNDPTPFKAIINIMNENKNKGGVDYE